MTLTIVVANLKGGSTKTTSAAFVLHALQEAGLSAIGVDADGENESLLRWSEAGEWATPVIGLPVNDLHRKLPGRCAPTTGGRQQQDGGAGDPQ